MYLNFIAMNFSIELHWNYSIKKIRRECVANFFYKIMIKSKLKTNSYDHLHSF